MKRKNASRLILVSIFLLLFLPATASAEQPAQVIMGLYPADYVNRDGIEPYIVSILALNEVAYDRNPGEVKQFLEWYFSRLNNPDKNGLRGTIYTYVIQNGREVSLDKYDSVDGYAGMFLHLLHQYVTRTGDTEILTKNWQKIEDIAALILLLQDKDGLTIAMPGHEVKYLMDNSECYSGIMAYLAMRTLVGKGPSEKHAQAAVALKKALLAQLFDSRNQIFSWAVQDGHVSSSTWQTFYPDALAQLFPLYHDLLIGKPELRNRLWRAFNDHYQDKIATFPVEQRIIYGLTSAKMGGI
jgi:hypothetical protein